MNSCTATPIGATTGNLTATNCAGGAGNAGCTYKDNNAASFGAGFAAAGGGVYVAELATDGIRVWFLTVSGDASLKADVLAICCTERPHRICWQYRYQHPRHASRVLLELFL
jgi:hypothetical protein